MIDLGIYIYGDTEDTIVYIVDENGDALPLTATTSVTLECRSANGETASIACTILDSDGGSVLVPSLGTSFTPTNNRPAIKIEARLKRIQLGTERWTRDSVKFSVDLFP